MPDQKPETAAEVLAEMRAQDDTNYEHYSQIKQWADRIERAHANELASLLPGSEYMDPPDGGDVTLLEQCRRMSEDAAKWRALSAQGEAVAKQLRRRDRVTGEWGEWHEGGNFTERAYESQKREYGIDYEIRKLYTHPAPARVTEEMVERFRAAYFKEAEVADGVFTASDAVRAALTAALEADHG